MNQTVLLAGHQRRRRAPSRTLFRGLVRARVRPYYLLQADPVRGTGHLRTPLARGVELMAAPPGAPRRASPCPSSSATPRAGAARCPLLADSRGALARGGGDDPAHLPRRIRSTTSTRRAIPIDGFRQRFPYLLSSPCGTSVPRAASPLLLALCRPWRSTRAAPPRTRCERRRAARPRGRRRVGRGRQGRQGQGLRAALTHYQASPSLAFRPARSSAWPTPSTARPPRRGVRRVHRGAAHLRAEARRRREGPVDARLKELAAKTGWLSVRVDERGRRRRRSTASRSARPRSPRSFASPVGPHEVRVTKAGLPALRRPGRGAPPTARPSSTPSARAAAHARARRRARARERAAARDHRRGRRRRDAVGGRLAAPGPHEIAGRSSSPRPRRRPSTSNAGRQALGRSRVVGDARRTCRCGRATARATSTSTACSRARAPSRATWRRARTRSSSSARATSASRRRSRSASARPGPRP